MPQWSRRCLPIDRRFLTRRTKGGRRGHGGSNTALRVKRYFFSVALRGPQSSSVLKALRCHKPRRCIRNANFPRQLRWLSPVGNHRAMAHCHPAKNTGWALVNSGFASASRARNPGDRRRRRCRAPRFRRIRHSSYRSRRRFDRSSSATHCRGMAYRHPTATSHSPRSGRSLAEIRRCHDRARRVAARARTPTRRRCGARCPGGAGAPRNAADHRAQRTGRPSFTAAANQRAASHSGPRRHRHLSRTRGPLNAHAACSQITPVCFNSASSSADSPSQPP